MRGCACRGTAGFAHVSCLAEQATILYAEGQENNLGEKVRNERWHRWSYCSLCEQQYHGVVWCALSWACWKTYVGRPETDVALQLAMSVLGNGLFATGNHKQEGLRVQEAELCLLRRVGASEARMLVVQTNLSNTYYLLGRREEASQMDRDIYSARLKLNGEEHESTLLAANNYASSLKGLQRFEEAKSLLRRTYPWRDAFSEIVMTTRSGRGGCMRRRSTWPLTPRSTISTRP